MNDFVSSNLFHLNNYSIYFIKWLWRIKGQDACRNTNHSFRHIIRDSWWLITMFLIECSLWGIIYIQQNSFFLLHSYVNLIYTYGCITTSMINVLKSSTILKTFFLLLCSQPLSPPSAPGNHWSTFYLSSATSRLSSKWNYTVCSH